MTQGVPEDRAETAETMRRGLWALGELQTLSCRPSMGGWCSLCLGNARALLSHERPSALKACDWGAERVTEVEAAVTSAGRRP